jgi:hypothetical protein
MSHGRVPRHPRHRFSNQQVRIFNAEESDSSQIQESRNEDDVSSIEITEDGQSTNVMLMLRQDDGNSTQASVRDMLKPSKKEDVNCSSSLFSFDCCSQVELRNFDIDDGEPSDEVCKFLTDLETVEETEEDQSE